MSTAYALSEAYQMLATLPERAVWEGEVRKGGMTDRC